MNRTKIETADWTWNPVTGCEHGCFYCYARKLFERYQRSFRPEYHPDRLEQPIKTHKGAVIFAVSAGDLLGDWVDQRFIRRIIQVMVATPQHTYQVLTKNPRRYREFDWPRNVWLGASASGQASYNAIAYHMVGLDNPTFLSAEPLSLALELRDWVPDWMIVGPMTGNRKAPPEPEDVRTLTKQAQELGVLVFHKDALRVQVGEEFIVRQFPPLMTPWKWRRPPAPVQAELGQ